MFKKLLSLWFGLLSILSAGTSTLYPIYTFALKKKFSLSIKSINIFSSFINIGNNASFIVGYIYDKYGPSVSNIIALICLPGCYFILYLISNSAITSINLIWLFLLALLIGQGSTILYASTLATTIKNFEPEISGLIVGLIGSSKTLGNSLFTSFKVIFDLSISNFILLLATFCIISIILCLIFLRIFTRKEGNDYEKQILIKREGFIIRIFLITEFISLIIFIVVSILQKLLNISFPSYIIFIVNLLIMLVIIILNQFNFFGVFDKYFYVPRTNPVEKGIELEIITEISDVEDKNNENNFGEEKIEEHEKIYSLNKKSKIVETYEKFDKEKDINKKGKEVKIVKNEEDNNNIKGDNSKTISIKSIIIMAVTNRTLINLFFIVLLCLGTLSSNLNNIKFISYAISQNKVKSDIYSLCYFSINSFSRMIASIILNKFIKSKKIFVCLIVIILITLSSQILGIFMNPNLLYISISLAGVANASIVTFIPIFCRSQFGVKELATIIGIIHTGKAIGSLVIGSFIFTIFYQRKEAENGGVKILENEGYCVGENCYRGGYIINAVLLLIALFISIDLYLLSYRKEKNQIKNFEFKAINKEENKRNLVRL